MPYIPPESTHRFKIYITDVSHRRPNLNQDGFLTHVKRSFLTSKAELQRRHDSSPNSTNSTKLPFLNDFSNLLSNPPPRRSTGNERDFRDCLQETAAYFQRLREELLLAQCVLNRWGIKKDSPEKVNWAKEGF